MHAPAWAARLPRWAWGLVAAAVLAVGAGAVALATSDGDDDVEARELGRASSTSSSAAAPSTTTSTTAATTTTVAAGSCPTLPACHQPDPDRPRYTVRLDADPVAGTVDGDLTVRFTPDLPVDRLVFRLWANAPRPRAAGNGITTGTPTSEGVALRTAQPDPTTLEVLLPARVPADRTVEVSLPFDLRVTGAAADRISRSGGALRLGSIVPLLAWEDGVGWSREPATALYAEAVSSPAADWSVSITAPPGHTVLASGRREADGRWHGNAMRDFAMSIGRFRLVEGTARVPEPVAVTVGVLEGVDDDPAAYLRRVVAALEDFSRRYGPYAWSTFTLAITPDLPGGVEFPAHVMQGPDTTGRTTPHEVAHQWFYGLVGNDQGRDPWIDEGLATFAEARHEGTLAAMQSRSIPSAARGHAGEPLAFWAGRSPSYYRGVYVQTAAALAALGDPDLTDCALAHFVARHAFRIVTDADVIDALALVHADTGAVVGPYGLP